MGKKVALGSGGGLITKTDAELTSAQLGTKNVAEIKNTNSFFLFQYWNGGVKIIHRKLGCFSLLNMRPEILASARPSPAELFIANFRCRVFLSPRVFAAFLISLDSPELRETQEDI